MVLHCIITLELKSYNMYLTSYFKRILHYQNYIL